MGGFINGEKRRIPGAKIFCNDCEEMLDESEFGFIPSKGYYSYCWKCNRERRRKWNNGNKETGVKKEWITRNQREEFTVPDTVAHEYKKKLRAIAQSIRVGDVMRVCGKKLIVEKIYGSFVLMMFQSGAKEAFVWDDVYKMMNGTFRWNMERWK